MLGLQRRKTDDLESLLYLFCYILMDGNIPLERFDFWGPFNGYFDLSTFSGGYFKPFLLKWIEGIKTSNPDINGCFSSLISDERSLVLGSKKREILPFKIQNENLLNENSKLG